MPQRDFEAYQDECVRILRDRFGPEYAIPDRFRDEFAAEARKTWRRREPAQLTDELLDLDVFELDLKRAFEAPHDAPTWPGSPPGPLSS